MPLFLQNTAIFCNRWSGGRVRPGGVITFMLALYKLKQHSELSHWFTDSQLAQLQASLNWDELIYLPGYTLSPDYPANYYGVAFSIARLRYLLGWEVMNIISTS